MSTLPPACGSEIRLGSLSNTVLYLAHWLLDTSLTGLIWQKKLRLSQVERAARPAMSELNAETGQNTLCACLAGNGQGATIDTARS